MRSIVRRLSEQSSLSCSTMDVHGFCLENLFYNVIYRITMVIRDCHYCITEFAFLEPSLFCSDDFSISMHHVFVFYQFQLAKFINSIYVYRPCETSVTFLCVYSTLKRYDWPPSKILVRNHVDRSKLWIFWHVVTMWLYPQCHGLVVTDLACSMQYWCYADVAPWGIS